MAFAYTSLLILALCVAAHGAPKPFFSIIAQHPLLKSAIIAEPTQVRIHEPTLARVGDMVEHVPTAISHQSSTIVHSHGHRVTPIVAPAVRSYNAAALRTYALPAAGVWHMLSLPAHQAQNVAGEFLHGTPIVFARSA